MIKANELYKACQEMSNKGFSISDINKTIRELESIKNTITNSFEYKLFNGKVSEFVEAFNMFKDFYNSDSNEYLNDAILSFKKGNNSQRVKFPNIKTDFTKKTERNKNRKKHVNPKWLNDIIRERYQLIEQIYDLKIKAEDTSFKIDALEFEVKELKLEVVFKDHNDD